MVDYVFGVTGSGTSWSLITEWADQGIPYYPVVHEAVAAIMAGAVSVKGKMGASISVKGPGLTNMLPGIANNHFENRPAISISEHYPSDIRNGHKYLDHERLLRPIVKHVSCSFEGLTEIACREPCGPVHWDLSDREYGYYIEPPERFSYMTHTPKKAVILVGQACRRAGIDLSHIRVPIFTTASAKGVIDETHPYSAGVYTGAGLKMSPEGILDLADTVIGINVYEHEFLKKPNMYNVRCRSLEDVIESLPEWGADEIAQHRMKVSGYKESEWLPFQCFYTLNNIEWDYDLVCDVGLFSVVAEHFWLASPNRGFYGSLNSRYMGTSVPTAMGLSVVDRKPTICVVGDGGSGAYLHDHRLLVEHNLPVCILVMSDGQFGSIASTSSSKYRKAIVATPPAKEVYDQMGLPTWQVCSGDQLKDVLNRWDRNSPIVLMTHFDSEMYRTMTKEIRT